MDGEGAVLDGDAIFFGFGGPIFAFTSTGAWIAPDKMQVDTVTNSSYKQTIIGDQRWADNPSGVTVGPSPSPFQAEDLVYVFDYVGPNFVTDEDDIECGSPEEINGVAATRCDVSEAGYEKMLDGLLGVGIATVSEATSVIWIAEDGGFLVRWELAAAGTAGGQDFNLELTVNVSDFNNVDSIEA